MPAPIFLRKGAKKGLTTGAHRGIICLALSANPICASGGIGRLAGFRCQCSQGRAGSTPASRTKRRTAVGSPSFFAAGRKPVCRRAGCGNCADGIPFRRAFKSPRGGGGQRPPEPKREGTQRVPSLLVRMTGLEPVRPWATSTSSWPVYQFQHIRISPPSNGQLLHYSASKPICQGGPGGKCQILLQQAGNGLIPRDNNYF